MNSCFPITYTLPIPNPTPPLNIPEGKSYTETEYKNVLATMPPIDKLWAPNANLPSFNTVMGFNGSPEIINGRLAMMGFIAAVGAELSSGELLALCSSFDGVLLV